MLLLSHVHLESSEVQLGAPLWGVTLSSGKIHSGEVGLSQQVMKIFLQTDCSGSVVQSSSQQPCTIHRLARLLSVSSSKFFSKSVDQNTTKNRTLYYLGNLLR